jgi:hypothetical protein
MVEYYSLVFICTLTDKYSNYFPLGAVMNNASMNIHVQVIGQRCAFISLGSVYIGVELLDLMVFQFNLLRSTTYFPKLPHQFIFSLEDCDCFSFSTS